MSKKVKLSEDDIAWLTEHHTRMTYHALARRFGVCTDTLKRILVRNNLQTFAGAKYQIKPDVVTWRRPCIVCGCTTRRPRNQYKCSSCIERDADAERWFTTARARKRAPYTPEVPF